MPNLLTLLKRFLTWLDNLFSNLWTGQPGQPTSPQKHYREAQPPPAPAPVLEQSELSLGSDVPPQYRKSKSILTFRERILYHALKKAVDNQYLIMAKVRMGDFVWLANEPNDRRQHINQILCKHVDFLLCTRIQLKPVLVIELDDPSHQWPGSQERDQFKDETFASISLPILRIPMQEDYDVPQLDSQIQSLLHNKSYFSAPPEE